MAMELYMMRTVDTTFLTSEVERSLIAALEPAAGRNVRIMSNVYHPVHNHIRSRSCESRTGALFVGECVNQISDCLSPEAS